MATLSDRVIAITADDLQWPFSGEVPYVNIKSFDGKRTIGTAKFDPFPCYSHGLHRVLDMARLCEGYFPLPPTRRPRYYLAEFEELARTNAYADPSLTEYEDGKWFEFEAYILLSGKRIPIHPAVTRYVVAHEYGHIVEAHVAMQSGCDMIEQPTSLQREYVALRGGNFDYGGRKWADNVSELFANDFRILVCGVDTDWWQHPNYTHPHHVPGLRDWWIAAVKKFSWKEQKTA